MADMALGLTKEAVEGTVSRVLSAIDDETKLKATVKRDLRFIMGELQMMESFLEMANDNKEHTSNKVVTMWVRQLRDLAFNVEDCVEFVRHLDTTSARVWWSWVWRLLRLPSCMTPAWVEDLNQAFAQLKDLKAMVDEMSQRNTRYNLFGGDDSGNSTTPPPVLSEHMDAAASFPSTVDILRGLWKANAKQSSLLKCHLKDLMTNGPCNKLRVISVWRSAGVDHEAEHILNVAYRDPEICKEFRVRAMVKLRHPFNIQEFLKTLLNQLYVTSCQLDTLDADLLHTNGDTVIQDEVRQLLSKHKYLIILEDLSSMVEWDLIKSYLPDLQKGSRIVISVEQIGFALLCTGEPYRVLQLALFPNDRYIYAFYKPAVIDIKELIRQLGQRRVISLWEDQARDTSSLVRDVYEAMKNKTAALKGVNFEKFVWVDVSTSPFSLEGFYRNAAEQLPGFSRYAAPARNWSKAVRASPHLCVIQGLQSKKDWDSIKDALVPKGTRSCIVIIANKEAVAKHCEDDLSRKIIDEEEANNAAIIIGSLVAQKVQMQDRYYSWGHHDLFGSHGCSRRIDEALFQFERLITPGQDDLLSEMVRSVSRYRSNVHAVWGATGVGKTSLVRFLYYLSVAYSLEMIERVDLPKVEELHIGPDDLFFGRFGWVDVPEPFDLAEFSRRLLLDFNSHDPVEMEKIAVGIIQGHNPIQQCYETIRDQKCLVVIDGLRSKYDWDSIEQAFLRHSHEESSILVITIDESVAEHCVNKDNHDDVLKIFHIRALDDKSAIDLFKKVDQYAKWDEREQMFQEWSNEQKLKHANRIVPKCGVLPKIIDAVAKSDHSFWENINDDIVTKLKNGPQFDHLRGVLSWMHSYFDGCSDSVKPCVFYLSVFPTNYKIRKAHLLRRWIAEGYSRDTIGCIAKENAEKLFNELVKLGIIQEVPGMPLCQISGFFREYIISQPMKDNLVFALEGHCKPSSRRTGQHLTIMESWEREQNNVFKSIDVSRLRSLTVYGEWKQFFVSDKMKRIRVLDLEGMSGLEAGDLEHIFRNLLSLKFICLRGCKCITYLPKTLGGLRQLESLDVRGTSIVTLPRAIIKLQNIQYIRAGMFLPFEDCTTAASEDDIDDADRRQPSGTTPTPPKPEGSDGGVVATSPSQETIKSQDKEADGARQMILPREAEGSDATSQPQTTIMHDKKANGATQPNNYKVGRWWTRLSPQLPYPDCRSSAHDNNNIIINGGVEVPKGIEDMPALHTLGTVNINGAGGKDFLTMLKDKTKFQKLLKLSVCGINKGNGKDLCDALSARDHLESLSLGLEEDYFTEDSCFNPPKALKSLRLYGHIDRLPAWTWVKDPNLVVNLRKFDLEVIISSQDVMDQLVDWLQRTPTGAGILRRLCIKASHEVRKIEFKQLFQRRQYLSIQPQVLKIDCSSEVKEVVFHKPYTIATFVKVLIIHCSKGSDFRMTGLQDFRELDTVWLKGYDDQANYVADLKEHIGKLNRKPVFKFEKLKST